ncbi:MAG TPA: hypothetical protein VFT82_00020 [Candidatus Paceibacterota bacterium]|nr:hypothetical protein [Candidatus Paceibacterota bacterium]
MFPIFSAIAATTLFSGTALIWKRLRDRGVGTAGALALGATAIPLWIALGIVFHFLGYAPASGPQYFAFLAAWVIGAFTINCTGTYLYRYRNLTELRAYQTSIAIFAAIVIDLAFFKTEISPWSIVAVVLLFISGWILGENSISTGKIRAAISQGRVVVPVLTFNAFLQAINIATYKMAISYQTTPLFQAVVGETLLFTMFFAAGYRDIRKAAKEKKATWKSAFVIGFLLFLGTVFEIYMIKDFSVSLNIVLSVIPIAIYSFYDFKNRHVKISKESVAALLLAIIGLVLAQF